MAESKEEKPGNSGAGFRMMSLLNMQRIRDYVSNSTLFRSRLNSEHRPSVSKSSLRDSAFEDSSSDSETERDLRLGNVTLWDYGGNNYDRLMPPPRYIRNPNYQQRQHSRFHSPSPVGLRSRNVSESCRVNADSYENQEFRSRVNSYTRRRLLSEAADHRPLSSFPNIHRLERHPEIDDDPTRPQLPSIVVESPQPTPPRASPKTKTPPPVSLTSACQLLLQRHWRSRSFNLDGDKEKDKDYYDEEDEDDEDELYLQRRRCLLGEKTDADTGGLVAYDVLDRRGSRLDTLQYLSTNCLPPDRRDFESTWALPENSYKLETYIRRYILHTTEPIQENPWTTFLVGFCFGVFLVQLLTAILAIVYLGNTIVPWEPGLRLYRSTFLVPLFLFFLGVNTYGWRTAGVNHVLIFEIDPRDHLNHTEIMQISGIFAVVWAGSLQLFLFSSWLNGFPTYAAPLFVCLFMPLYLFNPLPAFQYKSRRWLRRVLFRIFTAPFHPVMFADFWLADQLNSLAILFVDAEFFLCFYTTQIDWGAGFTPVMAPSANATIGAVPDAFTRGGLCSGVMFGLTPLIKCLPAWFRFAQCIRRYYDMKERHLFPHMVNAGKYSMTFLVTISAVCYQLTNATSALVLFIILSVLATAYCYAWDILMDWGLLDRPLKGQILRDELVYNRTWLYYAAMVEDLVLRLTWAFSIPLKFHTSINQQVLASVIGVLEVIRRFVWNFFRLENEHLNNCGQFRAVRDIYIQPVRPKSAENENGETAEDREPSPIAPKRYAPYLYRHSHDNLHQSQLLRSLQSLVGGGGGGIGGRLSRMNSRQQQQQPVDGDNEPLTSGGGGGVGVSGRPRSFVHVNLSRADAFPIADPEAEFDA